MAAGATNPFATLEFDPRPRLTGRRRFAYASVMKAAGRRVQRAPSIDLTPIAVDRVEAMGIVLLACEPLVFRPRLDRSSGRLLVVADARLDLHVFAASREDLVDELMQHVVFAWQTYAEQEPAELTAAARALGEAYRASFRRAA